MGKVINLHIKNVGGSSMDILELAYAFLKLEKCTNKKLQKLCYYAQALHLAVFNRPLVNERFEAWRHGPVCPPLYRTFKLYGSTPIEINEDILNNNKISSENNDFINLVYKIYGNFSADQLENLSHTEEPWKIARAKKEKWESSTAVIDENIMKNYYKNLLKKYLK